MKCIICNGGSNYYFSKTYSEAPFDDFMREIGRVDYHKCNRCGFVFSKTHFDIDESKWNNLNYLFHHYIENPDNDNILNQPPYVEQAIMISILGNNGIINTNSMIDYAAGYGTLSNILDKYFNLDLPIYDSYVKTEKSSRHIRKSELETYKTVINSAMFEHVLSRESLDLVNNLVDKDGCLIIHTVVCENVPNDPNWFYLDPPVHSAFHTNKSMKILMEQWGYSSSIYCPPSKCWLLLRDNIEDVEEKVVAINKELQSKWFYCKNGFVDYWKGF